MKLDVFCFFDRCTGLGVDLDIIECNILHGHLCQAIDKNCLLRLSCDIADMYVPELWRSIRNRFGVSFGILHIHHNSLEPDVLHNNIVHPDLFYYSTSPPRRLDANTTIRSIKNTVGDRNLSYPATHFTTYHHATMT